MASSSSSSSPEILHTAARSAAPESFSFKYASQEDVLEDLSSRFILNLPEEELASVERICFQVEQAHWYYEDFIREENTKFPSLPLKKFSEMLFHSCPLLRQWSHDHEQAFNTFMQYKTRVPVCGAIMLNDKWDKCVLVKGWKSSSGWGFPKGKINQDEEPYRCAIREVLEETGYDLARQIRPADYLEVTVKDQKVTLYIVGGVPEDYPFQTRTRKEISKIEWFNLADLPTWKRNKLSPGKFYMISPFVPRLKEFIKVNKQPRKKQNKRKGDVTINADLSIQTEFEVENESAKPGVVKEAYMVVRLDRDAHGSSSSSADNCEPQTPSPQSTEAFAVGNDALIESEATLDGALDPHLARLLTGLSLSASKPQLADQPPTPAVRKASIVPNEPIETIKELASPVPSESPQSSSKSPAPVQSSLLNQDAIRSLSRMSTAKPLSSNGSSMSILSPDEQRAVHTPTVQPPALADRHFKHLALLESVAKESSQLSSPVPLNNSFAPGPYQHSPHDITSPPTYPGPPTSVPPLPFALNCPPNAMHLPMHQGAPAIHDARLPPFGNTLGNPFMVRPMTSQAVFPPTLSPRRHGANMSMHQGSLLSILGGPNIPATQGRHIPPFQTVRPQGGGFTRSGPACGPGVGHPPPPPPMHASPFATHPLRVVPPPPGAFLHNSGPTTAPLPTGQLPQLPMIQPPAGSIPSASGAANGRAQLLSLLNFNHNTQVIPSTLSANAAKPI